MHNIQFSPLLPYSSFRSYTTFSTRTPSSHVRLMRQLCRCTLLFFACPFVKRLFLSIVCLSRLNSRFINQILQNTISNQQAISLPLHHLSFILLKLSIQVVRTSFFRLAMTKSQSLLRFFRFQQLQAILLFLSLSCLCLYYKLKNLSCQHFFKNFFKFFKFNIKLTEFSDTCAGLRSKSCTQDQTSV